MQHGYTHCYNNNRKYLYYFEALSKKTLYKYHYKLTEKKVYTPACISITI